MPQVDRMGADPERQVASSELSLDQLLAAIRRLDAAARSQVAQVLAESEMDARFEQLIRRLAKKPHEGEISDAEIQSEIDVGRALSWALSRVPGGRRRSRKSVASAPGGHGLRRPKTAFSQEETARIIPIVPHFGRPIANLGRQTFGYQSINYYGDEPRFSGSPPAPFCCGPPLRVSTLPSASKIFGSKPPWRKR